MSASHVSARIGVLWQQRMETLKEYEVVRDGNVFRTSFSNTIVFSSEYEKAYHQLDALVDKYRNVPFDKVIPGKEIFNECGVCFCQKSHKSLKIPSIDIDRFRSRYPQGPYTRAWYRAKDPDPAEVKRIPDITGSDAAPEVPVIYP